MYSLYIYIYSLHFSIRVPLSATFKKYNRMWVRKVKTWILFLYINFII